MQTLVPVVPEQLDVVVGQVGRVHDRRVRAEQVRLVQQPGRGDAVRRQAGLVLGDLLGEVDVQRGPAVEDAAAGRAAPPAPSGCARRARSPARVRPGLRVAVAVAHLHALGRLPEPAAEVAGVEQRDPDPGLARGLDAARWPIAFGSSYGVPSGWWCR